VAAGEGVTAVLFGPVGSCQAVGVSSPAEVQRIVGRLDEDVAVIVEGLARVEATQKLIRTRWPGCVRT